MGDIGVITLVDEGRVLDGGPQDWADKTGSPLEVGR